ncbi:MAG: hypothetical protein NXI07_03950, partial [bacterium]|nr:hypothetical protein [bacterium]
MRHASNTSGKTMNTKNRRSLLCPVLMIACAGSLATMPACGAKRTGFWNKNKQSQIESQQARQSSYFVAKEEVAQGEPQLGGSLKSNSSASIDAMSVEGKQAEKTYPKPEPLENTQPATSVAVQESSTVGFEDDSLGGSAEQQNMRLGTADAPTPVERDPYFTDSTESPAALRSGDISAFVYANAMGIELPSETNSDAVRATINVRQVTSSYAGSDFDPTVSPDGRYLVFASTQHRPTADIYVKSNSGSVVTRLTDDPAQDVMPTVSPDGGYIAFASDRTGSWDLFVMPFEGGKVVQLTAESAHDLHPTWSPDGRQIAFCRLGQQSGRWEIWVKDVMSDAGPQFVGFGLFPEWCPVSGTGIAGADQILFQRSRERGDRAFSVWTLDYNPVPGTAGRETEIAAGPNQALINPSWSPDGKFITFAAVPNSQSWSQGGTARPESSTIWMVSTEGTGKIKLTDGDTIDLMPVWGRNNDIFFVS